MGKKNRQRRRSKLQRTQKKTKQQILALRQRAQSSTTHAPRLDVLPNPFFGMSSDDMAAARVEMATNANTAYVESLARIKELLSQADPKLMISMLASRHLWAGVTDAGVATPNLTSTSISQAHVEYFQALALSIPAESQSLMPIRPEHYQILVDSLAELFQTQAYRGIDQVNDDEAQNELLFVQHLVRTHTRVVRNWGYHKQVKRIAKDIYDIFDAQDDDVIRYAPSDVIRLFTYLLDAAEDRATQRMISMRDVCKAETTEDLLTRYYSLIGQPVETRQEFEKYLDQMGLTMDEQKNVLMTHSDLIYYKNHSFNPSDIATELKLDPSLVTAIFDDFAMVEGELSSYEIEHFHLNNPVWMKPIIRVNSDDYFCALPQTYFSNIFPAIDRVFKPILGQRLSVRRASYLEDALADIVETRFQEGELQRGLQWYDNGRQYETDLVLFVDTYAVVIEAKSGSVSQSALRGAPDRMRRHIQELMIAPNEQSMRFKSKLLRMQLGTEVDDQLSAALAVPVTSLTQIVRVSVTLDDFATVQANLKALEPTGWIPDDYEPCPTMCLADFETLFDLLENPVNIIHYLHTRQEIEQRLAYQGDELDLIGFYLDTLFDIGNLEDNATLILSGQSAPLDKYYTSQDANVEIRKPAPRMSSLFKKILRQIRSRKFAGWMETSVILCRFSPELQSGLERDIRQCVRNVRRQPLADNLHNQIVILPGEHSTHALCISIHSERNAHLRDQYFNAACQHGFEPEHVQRSIVICINCDEPSHVYDRIAVVPRSSE